MGLAIAIGLPLLDLNASEAVITGQVPANAMLDEDGNPILDENGDYVLSE